MSYISVRTKQYAEQSLTHPAFLENGNATWMRDMANALVGLENMNVITVNWGDLSMGRYYCVVKKNMPRAGTSLFYFNCSQKSEACLEPCQTSMMKPAFS